MWTTLMALEPMSKPMQFLSYLRLALGTRGATQVKVLMLQVSYA